MWLSLSFHKFFLGAIRNYTAYVVMIEHRDVYNSSCLVQCKFAWLTFSGLFHEGVLLKVVASSRVH